MSSRLERYTEAVYLAQLILEGNEKFDDFRIEQVLQDVRDEVRAGRQNQREFPAAAARALSLIEEASLARESESHSIRVDPVAPPPLQEPSVPHVRVKKGLACVPWLVRVK